MALSVMKSGRIVGLNNFNNVFEFSAFRFYIMPENTSAMKKYTLKRWLARRGDTDSIYEMEKLAG